MNLKPSKWLIGACALAMLCVHARAQEAGKDAPPPSPSTSAAPATDPMTKDAAPETAAPLPPATGTAAEMPPDAAADPSTPVPPGAPVDPSASGSAASLTEDAAANPDIPTATDPEASPGDKADLKDGGAEAECMAAIPAEILTLREPRFGGGKAWDIVYSNDGMDVFSDLVQIDPQTLVAAGSYTADEKDAIYHPLLVKFDERRKTVWETRIATKNQQTIHRILKTKTGFATFGDISDKGRGNGIHVSFYDDGGKPTGQPHAIYEPGGDLDAKGFILGQDGGYIALAQFVDGKDSEKQHGLLYKISKSGTVVWKRAFRPGQSTVFNSIQTTQDGTYAIAGQIVLDGNKSGGWLVRVDRNGAIRWQRTYPRGAAASLQAVSETKDGGFILTGKARPFDYDGAGLTAWIMKVDASGSPLWQRYFKGPYSYEAPDLIVYEDGRSSVLVSGAGMDGQHRSHARLMTFSPQGLIHQLEDFSEGRNAAAHRLVAGLSGERILAGYSQTSFGEDQAGNAPLEAPSYTFDAWLMAGAALDNYEDPCKTAPKMSPLLP